MSSAFTPLEIPPICLLTVAEGLFRIMAFYCQFTCGLVVGIWTVVAIVAGNYRIIKIKRIDLKRLSIIRTIYTEICKRNLE